MSLFFAAGSPSTELSTEELRAGLRKAFTKIGERRKVLVLPPDFTRFHSRSGQLTEMVWEFFGDRLTDVLPALGTHTPMTDVEIARMFGRTPRELFRVHDWRHDVVTLGEVPGGFIHEVSEGKLDYPWPAQVNRLLAQGGHDLILSIGQVVPHEVVGMANGVKNVLIGTGGPLGIHRSHFLGAVYGMERMMGRVDTPVRRVLRYASERFARELPIVYVQTVVAKNKAGELVVRGLYVSDDDQAFELAAALSLECNFERLPREIRKAVVYLDPGEFRSTWLGNKSVYRTRMALADDAELIVLAPGVREFGEDAAIDTLIRRYGYCGTPATLAAVETDPELAANLSAAAHLIHGSSEGRFTIRYCPGHLSQAEIEGVHYAYGDLQEYAARYDPATLRDGWNMVKGEEIFFISNPGLGLWAYEGRLHG
ncbi:MAG: lactate racemase domain-containing protein [Janthinobacterium lividum]